MLAKRIVPCLDIKGGRVVKGVNFMNLQDAGDPAGLAKYYSDSGADELVFLDISATIEQRKLLPNLIESIAKEINIPFTVGGGIKSIEDIKLILQAGADKVSINSAAYLNPDLIKRASDIFGRQCIVVAIDAKKIEGRWMVHLAGGTKPTSAQLLDWAKQAESLGAGEILFTSMNNDGSKMGFANEALSIIAENVNIPIIASGGAGSFEHFADAFLIGKADAALAASVFHYGELSIPELKKYLKEQLIEVRI